MRNEQPAGHYVTITAQAPPKRRWWPVRAWRWTARHRLWLIPLTVPAILMVTAGTVHRAGWWPWFIPATLLVTAAVWIGAPDRWDRAAEVRFVRLSTAGIAAWLAFGAISGVWNTVMLASLGIGWIAWSGAWWWHKRVHSKEALIAAWDLEWQLNIHRMRPRPLTNSHVIDVDVSDEDIPKLLIRLDRGRQTIGDLIAAGDSILSALEVPPDTTFRVTSHARERNWAWFWIQHANPLADQREWDEDLAPESVLDEFVVGFTPEGGLIKASLRKAHWFIIGLTQWGKSTWLGQLIAQLLHCSDALVWVIDRKGGGMAAPWKDALDWVATEHDTAEAMLSAAKRIILARAAITDDHVPSSEDPAIFIVIDEANEVFGQGTGTSALVSLGVSVASLGAGASVHLVAATQIGGLSALGDERLRGNLDKCMAFRPQKDEHAQYALSDWAQLKASRLASPGMFYFKDGHAGSVLGRGFWLPRTLRARLARKYADRRPSLPEALQLHAGDAYLNRHQPHSPAPKEPAMTTTPRTAAEMAAQIEDGLPEPLSFAQMDAANEARAADGLPPLTAQEAAETGEARFIAALHSRPHSPKELIDASGMSRSWVMGMLAKLVEYGVVTQPGARQPYQAVPGMDLREAVDAIKADRRRLETQARELINA